MPKNSKTNNFRGNFLKKNFLYILILGILLRAKKYGLVHFEPEILFQGQDDLEPIKLMRPMKEIYDIYNTHKTFSQLLRNSD